MEILHGLLDVLLQTEGEQPLHSRGPLPSPPPIAVGVCVGIGVDVGIVVVIVIVVVVDDVDGAH